VHTRTAGRGELALIGFGRCGECDDPILLITAAKCLLRRFGEQRKWGATKGALPNRVILGHVDFLQIGLHLLNRIRSTGLKKSADNRKSQVNSAKGGGEEKSEKEEEEGTLTSGLEFANLSRKGK